MKKLLKYMKAYRKESILGPLFKLLEASFELFVPLVMALVIDVGIGQRDSAYIIKMCLIMVVLGVVGLLCSITAQYFAAKASVGFSAKLRSALFAHVQGFSYTQLDAVGTSTLITRMTSDINQVQNGVNLTLRLLLRSPFVVFGAMIMAFTIDFTAALVFVVAIPLLAVVVFAVMYFTMPRYKKIQSQLDQVLRRTRENLTGVRVVRAFGMEEAEKERFDTENNSLARLQLVVGRISALMNPITYVIINLGVAALLWVGAIRVDAGLITQGAVVALLNYMSQILVELIKLANLIISISKALACADRVEAILSTDKGEGCSAKGTTPLPRGTLAFQEVSLCYKGAGAPSLSGISFTAAPGETIGIIGGTGSGKTSLVNLIPRFYEASSGSVTLAGKPLAEYPVQELRGHIGIVPQKAALFHGTIRQNLCWGKEDAGDALLWQALELAQAAEFVRKKEGGLDAPVEEGGKNFSGGQRQRLTIARALIRNPEILILDDSASALDFATDAALRRAIATLPGKPTVFIVSQRASSVRHAHKIVVLDEGAAVGIGTHQELLTSCAVYREIYASQFQEKGGAA